MLAFPGEPKDLEVVIPRGEIACLMQLMVVITPMVEELVGVVSSTKENATQQQPEPPQNWRRLERVLFEETCDVLDSRRHSSPHKQGLR